MKKKSRIRMRWLIPLLCVSLLCVSSVIFTLSPFSASAGEEYDPITPAEVTNLSFVQVDEEQVQISGNIAGYAFSAIGKLYSVSNNINSNKIYLVETDPDYSAAFKLLNLEFEVSARSHNLNVEHQNWVGENVIRVAVYADGKFYYAEQLVSITSTIQDNVTTIPNDSKSPAMQQIISSATWYVSVNPKTLEAA